MANVKYGVVRLDRVTGTGDASKLLSARYYAGATPAPTDIQNGSVVHITTELLDREVFKTVAPTATDTLNVIGLVASVEIIKDSPFKVDQLSDFINKADGEPQRVYLLESGDIFSITAEVINNLPVSGSTKGKYLKLGTTTKWEYAATSSDTIADIIDEEAVGGTKFYVIRIR